MSNYEPVATTARDLTDALNRMSSRLEEVKQDSEQRGRQLEQRDDKLAKYGRKNRILILITIVSLVVDLSLTIALAVVAVQAHDAGTSAASAQKQGVVVVQKICATFGRLAELKPPSGNPLTYPSRGYLQSLHVRLNELGTDLGCKQ
jgi:hypothetical protein